MTAEPAPFVEALLARMSWTDKLNQLQIVWRRDPAEAAALARNGVGCLFWPQSAAATNELQRVAVEESQHGIPLLIGLDIVHGQFTIFPTPLAQASSFDPGVAELDARVSAAEARSTGVNWTFSPMVDVSRDPRWGRVVEGFGEDPYLTGRFAAAKVRGYQGETLAARDSVLACLKHYVAYGAAEGGRDYNTVDLSEHRLRNVYLEPFRSGVAAGAASVMASFNTLNGEPMHANRRLLTDVLKTEWRHEGIIVGDAEGVAQLVPHGVASDVADAVRLAFGAGLDVEMGGSVVGATRQPVISPDDVDEARIDDAVRRLLRLKFALGLFDDPYVDEGVETTGASDSSRALARTAAERSTVLLKNEGGLLPLAVEGRRVLLTGPYARSTDHLGAWVQHFAVPATSLEVALRAQAPEATVTVSDGAEFLGASSGLVGEAAAAARDHDLVIVAVGEPSALSGEATSRSDIRLPGEQEHLISAIADSGIPFVVVLVTGRPLDTSRWIGRAPAVLLAWHLGTEAAPAIARTLVGEVNPGGRLPMSFPRSVGQVPIHYDHESTGRPARTGGSLEAGRPDVGLVGPGDTGDHFTSKYLDLPLGPQFDFGHGLSYTEFDLPDATADRATAAAAELHAGTSVTVTVAVRNVGNRIGDDVVLVYVQDLVASLAPPVRRLRGFERVTLAPNEERALSFRLTREDLGFWTNSEAGEFVLEPGDFVITVTDGATSHGLPLRVE